MVLAESKIKRWGHSLAVVIPKESVERLQLKEGEPISMDIVKKERLDAFGIFKGAKPFRRDERLFDR